MDGAVTAPAEEPHGEERRSRRPGLARAAALSLAAVILVVAAARPALLRAAWQEISRILAITGDPVPASPPRLSDHEIEGLARMAPQAQAELLLSRAINRYEGASELIARELPGWRGRLQETPHLRSLLGTALNANDLRLRAAALELYLAIYDLAKNPDSVESLLRRIEEDRAARPWALWMLGCLGNRGVEPERVLEALLPYLQDGDVETRHWAVEGLAHLGTDDVVEPLLAVLHDDPSPRVRERAACSLAQSGMLRKEQRLEAVPRLIDYAEDPALDASTRAWAFQALRDITGANLPNDPAPWREWQRESLPPALSL